jgi:transcription initiation factor TFIID subunit TAF12
MNGYYPHGGPMEPLDMHIQKMQEFVQNPENLKVLTQAQQQLLGQYAAQRVQEMQQLIQQQQMQANAAAMQQQMQGGGQPGAKPSGKNPPPNTGPGGNPPVNKNEMLDESLPGAGGGANQ